MIPTFLSQSPSQRRLTRIRTHRGHPWRTVSPGHLESAEQKGETGHELFGGGNDGGDGNDDEVGDGGRAGGIDIIEAETVRQVWNVTTDETGREIGGVGPSSPVVR
jgi:hypothetical protein